MFILGLLIGTFIGVLIGYHYEYEIYLKILEYKKNKE